MKTELQKYIKDSFRESAEVKMKTAELVSKQIVLAVKAIVDSYNNGGKLLIFGNGGSAADAQHIQAELTHQFEIKGRKALVALALTTNSSVITAIGNDWSFDRVFERQVEGLASQKDVVLGISTSGNSTNVINGILAAKKQNAVTVCLLGKDGGKLRQMADIPIIVSSDNTARIQESHITIGHILCGAVERELFSKNQE